ncbi:AsmA family protein [Shewanella youngdeokensis]|uniref:AsmA family protein n=1 Tax=Shewanella youngdeokensis TaxID=2999068 RepID=A0ABZ0JVD6_9GAMM|nr:AsmA family protein [Shewanella sp. DAU334]
MKILKWFLIVVLASLAALVIYITVIFDPNDFKPQIVQVVNDKTGRELAIESDLSWTFFPSLGIKLGGITLTNPQGFKSPTMVSVNQAVAEVALMPLLKKEVQISQLNLDGLTLALETQTDGSSSFDGLNTQAGATETPDAETASVQAHSVTLSKLDIGGISITNTEISNFDHKTNAKQVLNLKSLILGRFQLDEFAPLEYELTASMPNLDINSTGAGQIKISNSLQHITINDFVVSNLITADGIPNGSLQANLTTSVELALDKQTMNLALASFSAADVNASGQLDIAFGQQVPTIAAILEVSDIDLDELLPQSTGDDSVATKQESSNAASTVEPDLTVMKSVDLDVSIKVKSVKVANVKTQNWNFKMVMQRGIANVSDLSAELYGGVIKATATLDGSNKIAKYEFDKRLSGVDIRALLMDAAEVDMLDGTANFNVAGKGNSLLPDNLKKNLIANGQFEIADGAIHGVNIPQMIRDAKAKLSGDLASGTTGEQKTDFTSMTGSFNVAQGVVANPDLNMASPLIRLTGAGTANIINEVLDYKLTSSVVGSLEGQGGNERDALYGVEIPVAISGTILEPKFALDTQALLNSTLKEKTDELKDSLLKKFGGF